MLKILKSIKNSLLILILLTPNAYAKVGKPSPKYDGAYTYTDFCSGDSQGAYDGSQFIIKDGMVTNDQGGAGRWEINLKKSKVGFSTVDNLCVASRKACRCFPISP